MKRIELYYFSGTGNTLKAVKAMTNYMEEQGTEVEIKSLAREIPKAFPPDTTIGLAFPINSQSVSPVVWKALKALPMVKEVPVFVLITLNESSGIVSPLYKLLKSKGFRVIGLCEVSMPNNMITGAVTEKADRERIEKGFEKIKHFSEALLSRTAQWKSENKGSAFVSSMSRNTPLPWFFMRKLCKFEIASDKCTRCGQCVRECPVSNIVIEEKPKHQKVCQLCMRCAAFCPHKAITIKYAGKHVDVRKGIDTQNIGKA